MRAGFNVQTVAIPAGGARAYRESEWRDAIVVIERGELELECLSGARLSFKSGDVLWFTGLPLLTLRNPGLEPAVIVAASRRSPPGVPLTAPGPSRV